MSHPRSLASICLTILTVALSAAPLAAETRTWTDSSGKFKIEADFIEILEGQVRLKRTDGKELSLPLAKLSKDDQAYLRELMKRRGAGESEPANPFEAGMQSDAGSARPRAGVGADDVVSESGLRMGDRVEVREHGKWQVGVVTGFDPEWDKVFVRLEESNRTVESNDDEFWVRPYDESIPIAGGGDAEVSKPDLTSIRRIVPLGGAEGEFKPDPAAATTVDWRPRPLGLNPKPGFFEKVTGLSFAAAGSRAAVAHVGGAEPTDNQSRIELCDLKTGRVIAVLAGPRGLKHISLSPSGQQLVTVSEVETFKNGPLQLWEIAGKELKHIASWHASSDVDRRQLEWIGWADDGHVMTVDQAGLTMWAINGPEGVYQISGEGTKAPAFSPGRKQIAIGTNKGLSIHDAASGELLTRLALEREGYNREAAFSPSGNLLAVTGGATVEIYNPTTGKKETEAYAGSGGHVNGGLCWLDEQHVLVGGSAVIHLPSQMTVWTYKHNADAVVPLAGRVWYMFGGQLKETPALLPFQLPHPGVQPVKDAELALRPGDQVSIEMELTFDLGSSPQGAQETPDVQLRKALTDAGFSVVENSSKRLIARTLPGETKEIAYRSFGAPFGEVEKTSYTQRVFELELIVDGDVVWQRRRVVDAPYHLQLQENESTDQAIQRVMQADVGFFRSTVPSRVLPTAAEQARTSTLSANGLE